MAIAIKDSEVALVTMEAQLDAVDSVRKQIRDLQWEMQAKEMELIDTLVSNHRVDMLKVNYSRLRAAISWEKRGV